MKKIVLAIAACLMATAAVADQYTVPVYKGPIHMPDFNGRDKAFKLFRTNIRLNLKEGHVNYGGKYIVFGIGCGTHCVTMYMADVTTGQIMYWPRGNDDVYAQPTIHKDSLLAESQYEDTEAGKCYIEKVVYKNGKFIQFDRREVAIKNQSDIQPCESFPDD